MTATGKPDFAPIDIGEVASPAFARVPNPATLFATRAARFKDLAEGHHMEAFLAFVADVAEAQRQIAASLSDPPQPDADGIKAAMEASQPVYPRAQLPLGNDFHLIFSRLIAALATTSKPQAAEDERQRLATLPKLTVEALARDFLSGTALVDQAGASLYVAAALQVLLVRLASVLPEDQLRSIGNGVCPCCGSHPVASMIVGWKGAYATRYLHCALCGTNWNYVRIKCTSCGSTGGIAYYSSNDIAKHIYAETCDNCKSYLKIMHQHKDTSLDPFADDLATYGLDIKIREAGWSRFGYHPFLMEF